MNVAPTDVAIAGGGLVGLSLAYELVSRGATVTVIDAGQPGRATDAGAGILAPATHPAPEPFWWDMVRTAGEHYPRLLERIRADGVDTEETGYATCGLLSVGLRESEDGWFAPFAQRVLGRTLDPVADSVREITPAAATSLFPPLGEVHRVLHYPAAARIDGRGMADVLRQVAIRRGARLISGTVSGVVQSQEHGSHIAQRVQLDDGTELSSGSLVIASGAWSAGLGARLGCPLPIAPTKGQIVHLDTGRSTDDWPIVQPLLTHYLVPWPGRRVACGGTFEPAAKFSATVTAAGLHELLRECLAVAPGLGDAEFLFARTGLRPTSPDERPVVGALPGWKNVWVATGHGANGLLLGPHHAMLLATRISGGTGDGGAHTIPAELDPSRFVSAGERTVPPGASS